MFLLNNLKTCKETHRRNLRKPCQTNVLCCTLSLNGAVLSIIGTCCHMLQPGNRKDFIGCVKHVGNKAHTHNYIAYMHISSIHPPIFVPIESIDLSISSCIFIYFPCFVCSILFCVVCFSCICLSFKFYVSAYSSYSFDSSPEIIVYVVQKNQRQTVKPILYHTYQHYIVTYLAILCDLFGMVMCDTLKGCWWPPLGGSNGHGLNHLIYDI